MKEGKRVAILGAGFAGLSLAWRLIERKCAVDLFDPNGIGGGASGIAAGLMHPYVGEQGRRSVLATEGLKASHALIAVAQAAVAEPLIISSGILRYVQDEAQAIMFDSHIKTYTDVKPRGSSCYFIESGVTLDCPRYLEGLWQRVFSERGRLFLSEMTDWHKYDEVVIAAGAAVQQFLSLDSIRILKGQVLECRVPDGVQLPKLSVIGKGYLALSRDPKICYIGSTYERDQLDTIPNPERAKQELLPKIRLFFPDVDRLEIISCKAALRVVRAGHYFPLAAKIKNGLWVFTGMGSRGLLYHAHLSETLANEICNN